jgi:putative hydrolase of the HAD superfamily
VSGTYSAIVFDVGNVLFGYNPSAIVDRILGDTPFKDEFIAHLFLSPNWQLMDRGDLSVDVLVEKLEREALIPPDAIATIPQLVAEFSDHLDPIDEMILLFQTLSMQYETYILSNFQDSPFDRLTEKNPFLNLARGKVVSAKVNMMKPEPEIYHHLLGHYNLDPASTIFIDDLPDNIEAAKQFGITGILYESPGQVRLALQGLGVLS